MATKVIYFLYRSFLTLLAPVVLFYAFARAARNRAYAKTFRERLGFLPPEFRRETSGAIWIHAVSVGEVLVAGTLIDRLQTTPATPVFLSASTLAGYRLANQRLSKTIAGCFYAPIDYAHVVRRVLRTLQPAVVVVLETEIWPNLFREAKRAGCGLLIANGRISDRAFPSYQRWRWFFRYVLCWPDRIVVQNQTMLERFVAAGAPPQNIEVAGNLKFDFEPQSAATDSPIAQWLRSGTGPVLIAASTTADERIDEDIAVLDVFRQLNGWRLILAPRRPERFDHVAEQLTNYGIPFWKRTHGSCTRFESVLLLDTIGELASLFPWADVVFMGGTLTRTGGHNFLEPAFAHKPIIVGPRLENFQEIADDFRAHRAFIEIESARSLPAAVLAAWHDQETGNRAAERAQARRGTARITADRISALQRTNLYCRSRSFPLRILLKPLAALWMAGSRRRFERESSRQRVLDTPVISVGNITVGGTGKTPVVLHLARRFREGGLEPVTLTRGYGRISPHDQLILMRGSKAAVWHTGDEPQILLRSGETGLAIAGDRYSVGRSAEQLLHPDLFLADDAFSHLRLARDIDIVLIDSLDPFGGCEAVPLGRLREPLESLRRADIFVITRCQPGLHLDAIENRLRACNARASIFRSSLVAREWISIQTGLPVRIPQPAIAFCGLGRPAAFWRSLDQLGIRTLDRLAFDDHHHYSPRELLKLVRHAEAARAGCLLTTEKDVVNFPEGSASVFGSVPVFFLRIEIQIEREEELLRQLSPDGIRARRASSRPLVPARR